jgi:hypothetical protein
VADALRRDDVRDPFFAGLTEGIFILADVLLGQASRPG